MARRRARCGTPSGYNRHLRAGDDACPACKKAHRDAQRAYYAEANGRRARRQAARARALRKVADRHPSVFRKLLELELAKVGELP